MGPINKIFKKKEFIINFLPVTTLYKLKRLYIKIKLLYNYNYFKILHKAPLPDFVIIDPINICKLKCPLCPTGINKLNYKKTMMSIDTFKTIINKLPSLRRIWLFNWGESFLNPDIFKMIIYAKEKGVFVIIDSNFNLKKNENFFISIVKSKLDILRISLDGASQETYSKYKIGGDFNLILSNIETLVRIKKRFKSDKPKIIWKFIVNKFNEHEIEKAKKMACRLGIDFVTDAIILGDDLPNVTFEDSLEQRKSYWLPKNKKYVHNRYKSNKSYGNICYFLFNTVTINPDGKVFPCCLLTNESNTFGDLLKESFEDIWNNDKYTYSRSLFVNKEYQGKKIETICSNCKEENLRIN